MNLLHMITKPSSKFILAETLSYNAEHYVRAIRQQTPTKITKESSKCSNRIQVCGCARVRSFTAQLSL